MSMFQHFFKAFRQRSGSGDGNDLPLAQQSKLVSDAEYALTEQSPRGGRLIIYFALACTGTLVAWAFLTQIDEIARADGKFIPSQTVQHVQSYDGGVLAELMVHEGEAVKKGQPLARIEAIRADAQLGELQKKYFGLLARATRLEALSRDAASVTFPEALLQLASEEVERETQLFQSKRAEITATVGALRDQARQRQQDVLDATARAQSAQEVAASMQQELSLTRPLLATGAVADVELLRLERDTNRAQNDIASSQAALARARAALAETHQRIQESEAGNRSQMRQQLNDTTTELAALRESLKGAEDRVSKTLVRAPVDGVVKTLYVKTIGATVPQGREFLDIVPNEDELIVEGRAQIKDIAYLHPGQPATVRLSTYDFSIHGGMQGTVDYISADATTDEKGNSYYIVRVKVQRPDPDSLDVGSRKKPIIAGMQATIDIRTSNRTVMTYLLKPLIKATQRAFTER